MPTRAALVAVLALAACVTPIQGAMRPATKELSFAPSSVTAKVVFFRVPQPVGREVSAMIIDGARGQVLGKSVDDSVFVTELEPGDYLICGLPIFEHAERPYLPNEAPALGLRAPVTKLSVAAGRTYFVEIALEWGPVLTAWPVRPGSHREELAALAIPKLRPIEAAPPNAELSLFKEPKTLGRWFDLCLDTSSDELRLRVRPEDGR